MLRRFPLLDKVLPRTTSKPRRSVTLRPERAGLGNRGSLTGESGSEGPADLAGPRERY